jgi:hypothetical protein
MTFVRAPCATQPHDESSDDERKGNFAKNDLPKTAFTKYIHGQQLTSDSIFPREQQM